MFILLLFKTKMKQQVVESKSSTNDTAQADECLFDYLHAEMVNYVVSKNTSNKVS